ncbi:MAG: hypothetical protein [Bacteriophage sp.]|nr:MAG: hypothetical protein [Bacteriophage sp.]
MKKYILSPKVVRGGKAIPLGNNFYYMQGRKHEQGGIDLGADDKNGLEVEGGEVVHTSKNSIKVFSAVPMLNGKSPAEKIINGENANKVFKEQEEFKDRNNFNDDGSKKYQNGGKRRYIGGSTNEARQKYFDTDKELTDSVKVIAKRYNINPNLLASRMAKEGPIDKAINYYNDTNGKFDRREVHGSDWGLDDTGNNLNEGIITLKEPYLNYYDEEFFNEKDRKVNSVYSPNWNFGISATAAELEYRRNEMKKRFPNLSNEQLDAAASAAFNRGIYGATKYIKQGRDLNEYSPFINIKKMGGQVKKNIFVELNVGGKKKLVPASSFTGERQKALMGANEDIDYINTPKYKGTIEEANITNPRLSSNNVYKQLTNAAGTDDALKIKKLNNIPNNINNKFSPAVGRFNKITLGDIIEGVTNTTGSIINYNSNRRALNNMKYSSAPLPIQAKKLKTRFNINPQLDKIREYLKATNRDIDANTASSRVALARKGIARTNALLQTNNLYATKENAETQLLNQDNMNQQNVAARNVEMYNRWREGKSNFDNMLLEKHAENTSDLIRGLTTTVQDIISGVEQRKNINNTLSTIAAANPNVTAKILKDLGVNFSYLISNGKRIKDSKRIKNKKN